MTKAVSNREFCFIKAMLLLCEHGHLKKNRKWCFNHPSTILGLSMLSIFASIIDTLVYRWLQSSFKNYGDFERTTEQIKNFVGKVQHIEHL